MIRFVFSTTWGPFSWAIQRRTNSPWSHIDVIQPDGESVIGALFWRGVVERPLKEVIEKASTIGFADCEVPDEAAFWSFMDAQIGKPYDRAGVLGIWLDGRSWHADDAWFCSELQAAALLQAGQVVVHEEPCLVTPRDLWITPTLKHRRVVPLVGSQRAQLIEEFGL